MSGGTAPLILDLDIRWRSGAAFLLWKETSIFKIRDHMNPRGGFDKVEKKKFMLPPGVEPRFSRRSVCNPVNILTEARRLH
jgi:hypothetical protein